MIQREREQGHRWQLSLLVLVNLLPLLGVLVLDWDVGALVLLYWSENLIIGFYTVLKMLVNAPLTGLGTTVFFVLHYGLFCAVHGMFVVTWLLDARIDPAPEDPWPFVLVLPQMLIKVIEQVLDLVPPQWLLAFAALFISHGISFLLNYVLGSERGALTQKQLMAAPYGRIIVLHIAIILGGFAIQAMGQPAVMLVILVLMKLGLDVKLQLREQRQLASRQARQGDAGSHQRDPGR